ncbi:DeoR family transcriptional regulator [Olsenella sp. YH-ols2221]|uniref:DeoR family transcriptional regulator n=1 Tax=Olsenella kribbiana TaxID=3115221 RepID=UPI002ED7C898
MIVKILKELHLTEGRNTGIHKMLQSLAENGSPEPLLETDEDRIYFLTTIYKRNLAERQDAPSPRSQAIAERRERLLVYLSEHPASSLAEASVSLGVSRATTNRDMSELRAQGRIRHEGASRTGRWIVL